MRTDAETLHRTAGGLALAVAVSAGLAPRLMLRAFGIPGREVTGTAAFGWRLFAVRTGVVGAGIVGGNASARSVLLPVQLADQVVFAHAKRSGGVPAGAATLAQAISGVLIALDLGARLRR